MTYAIIRVKLPAAKCLEYYCVSVIADGLVKVLEIEKITIRRDYVRNKQRATSKAKAVAGARASKSKAIV